MSAGVLHGREVRRRGGRDAIFCIFFVFLLADSSFLKYVRGRAGDVSYEMRNVTMNIILAHERRRTSFLCFEGKRSLLQSISSPWADFLPSFTAHGWR